MYGQRVPIKSIEYYDPLIENFFIIEEYITNGDHFWNFDEFGNQLYTPNTDNGDLPMEYRKVGKLYIKIKDYAFDQDNIDPFICYRFEIYMFGKETTNQEGLTVDLNLPNPVSEDDAQEQVTLEGMNNLTDNFGYSDIYDCLSRAVNIIKTNKEAIITFFNSISI